MGTTTLDQEQLEAFTDRFTTDLAAAVHAATVVLGDKLGLFRALADHGPQSPAELAERTGCAPRLVEEWLNAQAASAYCRYDPETGRYWLTPEQAACLADDAHPAFLAGGLYAVSAAHKAEERLREAFRADGALAWEAQDEDLFVGTHRFFGPRYAGQLVGHWIPALDGVEERLRAGSRVADVGCGQGAATILLAEAFPASTFAGFDVHGPSIAAARKHAAEAGVSDRVTFEVADGEGFPGDGYELVCCFNAFHEMGDPAAVARRIRRSLAGEGTWMLVEPRAGDRTEENHNPTGRMFYSNSTLVCVPNALSQGAARALGAQAGEAALRALAEGAGFTRIRRAAATPFMGVLEIRP